MGEKRRLSDTFIRAVRLPATGRTDYWDTVVQGLGLRVSASGSKSYVVSVRWPGTGKSSRRKVGDAAHLPLSKAREKSRKWLELVAEGIDPAEDERARRAAEARERAVTFRAVGDAFIAEHVAGQRRAAKTEAEIRRYLIARWGDTPINEITAADIVALLRDLKATGRTRTGHNVLSLAKTLWSWALAHGDRFGMTHSPAAAVRGVMILGRKSIRQRVLNDDEIAALWRACGRVGDPGGAAVKMLLLTACRLNEVAQARWSEIDLDRGVLVVPAARFKSDATHVVPLSDLAVAILRGIPNHADGDAVFTTTRGAVPSWLGAKIKRQLDKRITLTLKAMARRRGGDPSTVSLERWTFHDLRRTARTRLAGLGVAEHVAEQAIGHGRRGLARVYDMHRYEAEVRDAMQLWSDEIARIVGEHGPEPSNVVNFAARG